MTRWVRRRERDRSEKNSASIWWELKLRFILSCSFFCWPKSMDGESMLLFYMRLHYYSVVRLERGNWRRPGFFLFSHEWLILQWASFYCYSFAVFEFFPAFSAFLHFHRIYSHAFPIIDRPIAPETGMSWTIAGEWLTIADYTHQCCRWMPSIGSYLFINKVIILVSICFIEISFYCHFWIY